MASALVFIACQVDPIPSIEAPLWASVSSLVVSRGEVVVVGRAGSVPARSTVVASTALDEKEVRADSAGGFSVRVHGEVGDSVSIQVEVSGNRGPALDRDILSASDPRVPKPPASDGRITVSTDAASGQVRVAGAPGSVPADASVLIASVIQTISVTAAADGSFSALLDPPPGGSLISVLVETAGFSSSALDLAAPSVPGDPIPTVTAVVASSLANSTGLSLVVGKPGTVPVDAAVTVTAESGPVTATVDRRGGFLAWVDARQGEILLVTTSVNGVEGVPAEVRVLRAADPSAPLPPSSSTHGAQITLTRKDSGDLTITGPADSAPKGSELFVACESGTASTLVADNGAFWVAVVAPKAGSKVALLAVRDGSASAVLELTVPAE